MKLRELDAGRRALPDFLILGAMKAGTTSLFNYLCLHPRFLGSVPKEIFYFCSHPERGERWYRRHFPRRRQLVRADALTGEATPISLYSAAAAQRAAALVPRAKGIVLLREPAARAVSHYHHMVRTGRESRPVDAVFTPETIDRWVSGKPLPLMEARYLGWSDYATGLRSWFDAYPREQLLILQAEALFRDPQAVTNETLRFLDRDPFTLPTTRAFNTGEGKAPRPVAFPQLVEACAAVNAALPEFGVQPTWLSSDS